MTGVNIKKLKGKMVENDVSMEQLAEAIGINKATLYRKFSDDGKTLLVKEANAIVESLKLTKDEAMAIFFAGFVA